MIVRVKLRVDTEQAIGWRVLGEYGIPLIIAYTTGTHELPSKLNTIYYERRESLRGKKYCIRAQRVLYFHGS
jgi:hypothetical protein